MGEKPDGYIRHHSGRRLAQWKIELEICDQRGDTRLAADDFNLEPMIVDECGLQGIFFQTKIGLKFQGHIFAPGMPKFVCPGYHRNSGVAWNSYTGKSLWHFLFLP